MTIHIQKLKFTCIVGLLDFERIKEQEVIVTCKIDYDYKEDDFINYADVTDSIISMMREQKFELLESALEFISDKLLSSYPTINLLYIKIIKPDILENATVGVSQEYKRH